MEPMRSLAAAPRWHGQAGRLEVWYATATDPVTGAGAWVHHERSAPHGGGPATSTGWVAVFPPDGPPAWTGYGPEPVHDTAGGWLASASAQLTDGHFTGRGADGEWDVRWVDDGRPLWTFPRAAWARNLLPGAQVVLGTGGRVSGTATVGERTIALDGAPGATAHIYGHGNAQRWGWLHADLRDGTTVEVVTAVSRRPGLDRLPPLAFVRIRHDGADLPALPTSPLARTALRADGFRVEGRVDRRHRIRIAVDLPPERCVRIPYVDPDGSPATCTNSERAEATILVERRAAGGSWRTVIDERLDATAHAEVGTRP